MVGAFLAHKGSTGNTINFIVEIIWEMINTSFSLKEKTKEAGTYNPKILFQRHKLAAVASTLRIVAAIMNTIVGSEFLIKEQAKLWDVVPGAIKKFLIENGIYLAYTTAGASLLSSLVYHINKNKQEEIIQLAQSVRSYFQPAVGGGRERDVEARLLQSS